MLRQILLFFCHKKLNFPLIWIIFLASVHHHLALWGVCFCSFFRQLLNWPLLCHKCRLQLSCDYLASLLCQQISVFCFQPYDFLSLIPVIEGAGGVITDWKGNKLQWNAVPDSQATSMHYLLWPYHIIVYPHFVLYVYHHPNAPHFNGFTCSFTSKSDF